jgi:hypothetical protein
MPVPGQRRHQIFRAASLERTNWVQRFDFDDDAAIEPLFQRLRTKLRRVEKRRVNDTHGLLDSFHRQTVRLGHRRSLFLSSSPRIALAADPEPAANCHYALSRQPLATEHVAGLYLTELRFNLSNF